MDLGKSPRKAQLLKRLSNNIYTNEKPLRILSISVKKANICCSLLCHSMELSSLCGMLDVQFYETNMKLYLCVHVFTTFRHSLSLNSCIFSYIRIDKLVVQSIVNNPDDLKEQFRSKWNYC